MAQQPSIGRIVHYHSYGTPGGEYTSEPRAAIVTAVHTPECVSLAVLNPEGLFFNKSVNFSEEPQPGCWTWPPFVPPTK